MHKIQIPANWLYWYRYKERDTYVCIGIQPDYIDTFVDAGFGIYDYDLELPIRQAGDLMIHPDEDHNLAYCVFKEASEAIRFKFALGEMIAVDLKEET